MKNKLPSGIARVVYDYCNVQKNMYFTVSYVARKTGFSEKEVLRAFLRNPQYFKKSYLKSARKFADVYFIRKNCFWKLRDIWYTFCYFSYLKY